jgi:hypothetical protein
MLVVTDHELSRALPTLGVGRVLSLHRTFHIVPDKICALHLFPEHSLNPLSVSSAHQFAALSKKSLKLKSMDEWQRGHVRTIGLPSD